MFHVMQDTPWTLPGAGSQWTGYFYKLKKFWYFSLSPGEVLLGGVYGVLVSKCVR